MIPKNDIQNAQREAAKDRAHEMCIDKIEQLSEENETLRMYYSDWKVGVDKIKQLSEQNSKLLDDKIKLDGKMDQLYGDIKKLEATNEMLKADLYASLERNRL